MLRRRRQRRLERGQRGRATAEPPATAALPLTALGVASEAFQDALGEFLRADPEGDLLAGTQQGPAAAQWAAGSPGKKVHAAISRSMCQLQKGSAQLAQRMQEELGLAYQQALKLSSIGRNIFCLQPWQWSGAGTRCRGM